MFKIYGHILNIDDTRSRNFVRFLFAFLVVIRVATLLFPLGDSDFYPMYKWSIDAINDSEAMATYTLADLPMTTGNWIYLITELLVAFCLVISSFLYCGIYIRDYRLDSANRVSFITGKPIKIGDLILRIFILCVLIVALFTPIAIFVLYLPLIFIIIFPCLIQYVATYLSGDKDLIDSIGVAIKKTRGFFLILSRDLSMFFLAYFLLDNLLIAIGNKIAVVSYVVRPFLLVYIFLLVGRYAAFVYCRFLEITKPVPKNPVNK